MVWTLHMIMCVLLYYPVSFHMLQLLLTGRPISSFSSKMAPLKTLRALPPIKISSLVVPTTSTKEAPRGTVPM